MMRTLAGALPHTIDLGACSGDICEEPLPQAHPYTGIVARPAVLPHSAIVGQRTILRGLVDFEKPPEDAFRRVFVPFGHRQGGALHLIAEVPGEYTFTVTNRDGETFPVTLIVVPDEGHELALYNAQLLGLREPDLRDPLTWALLADEILSLVRGAVDEVACGHEGREGLRAIAGLVEACRKHPHQPTLFDVVVATKDALLEARLTKCTYEDGIRNFHAARRCVRTWKTTRDAGAIVADVLQVVGAIVAAVLHVFDAATGGSTQAGTYVEQAANWIASTIRPGVIESARQDPAGFISALGRVACSYDTFDALPKRLEPVRARRLRHAELVAPLQGYPQPDVLRRCADGTLFVSIAERQRVDLERTLARDAQRYTAPALRPGVLGSLLPSSTTRAMAIAPTLVPPAPAPAPAPGSAPTSSSAPTATATSATAPGVAVPLLAIVDNLSKGLEFELGRGLPNGRRLPPPISRAEESFWESCALAYARGMAAFEGTLYNPSKLPVEVPPYEDAPPVDSLPKDGGGAGQRRRQDDEASSGPPVGVLVAGSVAAGGLLLWLALRR